MRNILIILLLYSSLIFSQHFREETETFQSKLNEFYMNPGTTPLKEEELIGFPGIHFFPFDKNFVVKAQIDYLENQPVFKMASSGKKQQEYRRFAILHFELYGEKYRLEVYQNILLSKSEEYKNSYFLPFLDDTNGKTTAEQGRYIDLIIPEKAKEVMLNFNMAYHPYCAYTHGYSCPITPFVNLITRPVEAGVKY